MEGDRYDKFVSRRRELNDRLASLGKDVDDWIDRHERITPEMPDLARLEGLLQQRRRHLTELAALDDDFMNFLVSLRSHSRDSE